MIDGYQLILFCLFDMAVFLVGFFQGRRSADVRAAREATAAIEKQTSVLQALRLENQARTDDSTQQPQSEAARNVASDRQFHS